MVGYGRQAGTGTGLRSCTCNGSEAGTTPMLATMRLIEFLLSRMRLHGAFVAGFPNCAAVLV